MTTSHWLRQHSYSTESATTDVLIVGGGYVGLSAAYWITELRPDLKVTVLERSYCGAGASGRNAGFLTVGSASFYKSLTLKWGEARAKTIHQFATDSLTLVYKHILKSSADLKFDHTTSMTLFQTEAQFKNWSSSQFNPKAFNFEWHLNENLPKALQNRFYGAFETGSEFKINPIQLLTTLKKIIESRKVVIIENNSAFQITPEGVRTETHLIKAKQVVLAINGHLAQFHQAFKDAVTPKRAQMLAVELEEEFECSSLYYDPAERVYWRKTQDKILIIGGKRLLDEEGENSDFEKISPVIQQGLEQYLRDQLGLKYKMINRWSGIMGFTEHELPIIQRVNAPLETYVVGGFSGHGMGLGFRSGKDIAQLVTGDISESFFHQFKKVHFNLS
jgi:gamma-glutamylputrescine oxidase